MKELDRLQILTRIAERRLTRRRAGGLLQIGERHVRRLYRAFIQDAARGSYRAGAGVRAPAGSRPARPSPNAGWLSVTDRVLDLFFDR